jgi:hypothetical protein
VPFGGKKQSGIGTFQLAPHEGAKILNIMENPGRELGSYALEEYTSIKGNIIIFFQAVYWWRSHLILDQRSNGTLGTSSLGHCKCK